MRRILPLTALLLLALLLVACGGNAPEVTSAPAVTSTYAEATTPAATTPPAETTAPATSTTAPAVTTADPRPPRTPQQYTVTFDPVGGGATIVKTVAADAKTVTPPADPVREGLTFLGWFYDNGTPYHGEIIVRDTRLTAHYAALAHTVRFIVGSEATAAFTSTRVADGAVLTDIPHVLRPNEVVEGWYYDAEATRPYGNEPITADLTLYPRYRRYAGVGVTALPAIHITTEGGAPILSKEEYIRATVTLEGGTVGDGLNGAGAKIRGRGNSTWRYFDKKPYRIKLDTAADLLGLGRERDFVLLANAGDPTMLHNALYFSIAATLGDTVTSKYAFVSVYLNGAYEGIYLLCEQNEAGDNRVPIDDGESGLADCGYLVEFGGNTADGESYSFPMPAVTHNGMTYEFREGFAATLKSPESDVMTEAQRAYIYDYTVRVNRAIFTGDFATFTSLCDLDSFVRAFIVNEMMMNNDLDYSVYFYKPAGGKLCFGPLWDADQSAGTSLKCGTRTDGFYVSRYESWLTSLWQMPEFRAAVKEVWQANRAYFAALPALAEEMATAMQADLDRNYTRHPLGRPYWRICPEHIGYTTYEEHFAFLADWLAARYAWLDAEIMKE